MSLEKDIKQSSFRTEHFKAVINILYTYNWLYNQLKVIFESEGLTMQQYNILRILRGSKKPLSTMQIRERMVDKMSDSSRIVDRLVIKKYVSKIINIQDKRLVDITITKKGIKILAKLDIQIDKVGDIIKLLSEKEATQLNILLDKARGK